MGKHVFHSGAECTVAHCMQKPYDVKRHYYNLGRPYIPRPGVGGRHEFDPAMDGFTFNDTYVRPYIYRTIDGQPRSAYVARFAAGVYEWEKVAEVTYESD